MFDRNAVDIDINENDILNYDRELLAILLKDNSSRKNIVWATDNYSFLGNKYQYMDEVKLELISGENFDVIKPRSKRTEAEQRIRVKDKAEVFTPSWVCNMQNNMVDNAWFESKHMFNKEEGKGWVTNNEPVSFSSSNKSWKDYVESVCLEVSCGEAPYLVSRYDSVTGIYIPVSDRIGLLDRKLRIVLENTSTAEEWMKWTKIAFQCIYGYDWQGDNVLIARENLLFTYIEYFKLKFGDEPLKENLLEIATIISWNIWQMDGLKCVIPNTCTATEYINDGLFESSITIKKCKGCKKKTFINHNGINCKIKDWKANKVVLFSSLLK